MSKTKLYKPLFIDGNKTQYAVSKNGDILSLNYGNTKKIKCLKLQTDDDGYKTVHLRINGVVKNFRVHRLVAMVYISLPKKYIKRGYTEEDLEVNHKDGDKSNNSVYNLEWCTTKENILHAEKTGLRKHNNQGEKHPLVKYKEKQIRKVCKLLEENILTIKQISTETDVDIHTVYDISIHNAWTIISDDYDIDNHSVKSDRRTNCPLRVYDINDIDNVCKLLEEGELTMKQISDKTGISTGLIQKIKYGVIYQDISEKYNFKIRKGNYRK